uniref:Probable inactive acireductone dioxygenase n=1 Tax=Tetraselmis sp. GSL018 TaxID=582737 RepID=A0A061SAR8_9CHLO|mmetsp:Transcript_29410/g.70066  ORF Transcript_29410/g.70066 Transcript_29410/m.70066 type:complete len:214 (+) Transcript_29410:50-691(+)
MASDNLKREAECTAEELKLAQPLEPSEVQLEAWYMDDSEEDQREPHRKSPNEICSAETLKELGVLVWKLDPSNLEDDPKLKAIRKVRGYTYHDVCCVAEGKLPEYEKKIKTFFEEPIHNDEEIRYILDGNGYFDVRDKEDRWVRISVGKGDMVVLPAGMYHRYTNTKDNYVQCMRLFAGEPVWTAHNRPQEDNPARKEYVDQFLKPAVASVSA